MFRASTEKPFDGPHQNQQIVTGGFDAARAKAAMILIHGRGATADSILSLADEFHETGIYYIAPQAAQYQWYPYSFLAPVEKNEPGLSSGLQVLFDLICDLREKGFPKEKIMILGFSQGACLAAEFVARHPGKYGAVFVLSGGLIGDTVSADNYSGSLDETPLFMGCSDVDPHIPVERVHKSAEILSEMGADVTKKIYPGMLHTVNMDEIDQVRKIIAEVKN